MWSFFIYEKRLRYIYRKEAMIYLKHTTDAQVLFIPKEGRRAKGKMAFKAYSTINQFGFVDEVVDMNTSVLYHRVSISLKENIPAGEYEYTLYDEDGELSTGLLVVGDLENPMEYNKVTEYEQYEN